MATQAKATAKKAPTKKTAARKTAPKKSSDFSVKQSAEKVVNIYLGVIDKGIDTKRMVILPVTTVQEFRTQSLNVLNKYLETPEGQRVPMMLCLDSLGMLSTTKEVEDTAEGKETRDMTRAQVLKAAFRVLTLKLGKAKVPMVVTNHTYDVVGSYIPMKEMGGGSGLKYAASSIVYLSKKKEKDGTEVIGNIVKIKNQKSRLTKENSMCEVRLTYDKGLDRYYICT